MNRTPNETIEFYFGIAQLVLGAIAVIAVACFLWSLFP